MVIISCERDKILAVSRRIRSEIRKLGERLSIDFDLLVLTQNEFAERPIRDMDSLVFIYSAPLHQVGCYQGSR